jgi:hypothetical protein
MPNRQLIAARRERPRSFRPAAEMSAPLSESGVGLVGEGSRLPFQKGGRSQPWVSPLESDGGYAAGSASPRVPASRTK